MARAASRLPILLLLAIPAAAQHRSHRLPLPATPRIAAPLAFRSVGLLDGARELRVRASADGLV